jgi:hypothetical protein
MTMDSTIFLIGEMQRNVRFLLIELPVGFFELFPMSVDRAIFLRIDKTRIKKEFP